MPGTATLCRPGAPYAHQVPDPAPGFTLARRPSAGLVAGRVVDFGAAGRVWAGRVVDFGAAGRVWAGRVADFAAAACGAGAAATKASLGTPIGATTPNINGVRPLSSGGLLSG